VVKVTFLANKSPMDVTDAIGSFTKTYVYHWQRWQTICKAGVTPSVAPVFGEILRKWQATRPLPMRRPRQKVPHQPPYLEDLIEEALPHIRVLGTSTVRDLPAFTPQQVESLSEMWEIFRNLTTKGQASCVGITKAVMLLTLGQIGPALDSKVRSALSISQPTSAEHWLDCLRAVSIDIRVFESRYGIALEDLVPIEWQPVQVGRVYDMIAGPKGK
jgi:hypothetical protein